MKGFNKRNLLAGLFGNALEWYDFILYANFSPIIAKLFFPAEDAMVSLLLTFAVFATGFFARPFGAILLGHIGDKYGRRIALITSIILISIPTLLIGLLPTFATVGMLSPIILTLIRLLQGLAVGGELSSAATFVIEHAPHHRRGFAGCLVMTTAFVGMLFGAFISYVITETFSMERVLQVGWRLPFLLGGILGLVGLWIRLQCEESPAFSQNSMVHKAPLIQLFSFYKKPLILSILLTSGMAVGNYVFIAYITVFLVKIEGFTLSQANEINLIAMGVMVIFFPFMGLLSDTVGRKSVMHGGLLATFLLAFPIFWLFIQKTFSYALLADILLCMAIAPIAAIIPTTLAELFPTAVRNCGSALGYNISLAIFGGTTPYVCLELVHTTGSAYSAAWYLLFFCLISSVTLFFVEENFKRVL